MILHITEAKLAGPTSLFLRFNDGCAATIDLSPLLTGPVLEPLLDPAIFAQFELDPTCKTICWPNQVDLAPESIRSLVQLQQANL